MKLKDHRINASCASMSDENNLNGDSCRTWHDPRLIWPRRHEPEEKQVLPVSSSREQFPGITSKSVNERQRELLTESKISRCKSPCTDWNTSSCSGSVGGRLKFFKDGKFILELSHKKEGDKTCWIPVSKKPCWPPIGTPRPGSLTSLSVASSDDNSSLNSFPSQREHRWKQSIPRSNLNKDLEFWYHKAVDSKILNSSKRSYIIRRRPFDSDGSEPLRPVVKNACQRDDIASVVQFLWERIISTKPEPDVVSPRKRILKEFEKVSLEETSKRQKGAASGRVISTYSVATILEENDSVLRNLLRSPSTSPDSVISHPPSVPRSYQQRDLINSLPPVHFPHNNLHFPPYRVPQHGFWPLHYPLSNSIASLPIYPVPHYLVSAHQPPYSIVNSDPFSDAPLNLSKHSG